jgi:hypothetical protein
VLPPTWSEFRTVWAFHGFTPNSTRPRKGVVDDLAAAVPACRFARATSAAQISAAISVAIVLGEYPSWFSQLPWSVRDPCARCSWAAYA